jgi:hypothetical protein
MRCFGRSIAAAALAVGSLAPLGAAHASRAGTAAPLPVFKPILRQLSAARIPVYLPTWLPNWGKVYPFVNLFNNGKAFEIDLTIGPAGPAESGTNFWIAGNLNPLRITPRTKKIRLRGHRTAYVDPNVGSNLGTTIGWKQHGYVYMIGRTGTSSDLIRAANSLVRVH